MAGKIVITCCQGKSLDKRHKFYPYWRMKIVGDDGKEATATISFSQLREAIKTILLHEFRVDILRKRKPEYTKYRRFFQELTEYYEQLKLEHFSIPEIYVEFNGWRYEKEITLGDLKA